MQVCVCVSASYPEKVYPARPAIRATQVPFFPLISILTDAQVLMEEFISVLHRLLVINVTCNLSSASRLLVKSLLLPSVVHLHISALSRHQHIEWSEPTPWVFPWFLLSLSNNTASGVCLVFKALVFFFFVTLESLPMPWKLSFFVHFHNTSRARLRDPTVKVFSLVWSLLLVWFKMELQGRMKSWLAWKTLTGENDVCKKVWFYKVNLDRQIVHWLGPPWLFRKCMSSSKGSAVVVF